MIDLINEGYPHMKLAKTGNKGEFINRIVTANNFIKANNFVSSTQPASSSQLAATSQPVSSSQPAASSEPAFNQVSAKRAKTGEKNAYITLINDYNAAQVADHDVSRRGKVIQLSKNGSAEVLRHRLVKAGVTVLNF
jgi:hypothetical protein